LGSRKRSSKGETSVADPSSDSSTPAGGRTPELSDGFSKKKFTFQAGHAPFALIPHRGDEIFFKGGEASTADANRSKGRKTTHSTTGGGRLVPIARHSSLIWTGSRRACCADYRVILKGENQEPRPSAQGWRAGAPEKTRKRYGNVKVSHRACPSLFCGGAQRVAEFPVREGAGGSRR